MNIRKGGHRELERYYQLMEIDFERDELMSKLSIHKGIMRGAWELVVIYDEETGMDIAYALVGTKNLYAYALLKYFAVLPWYRDKGLGVQSMRLINRRYADRQGIVTELRKQENEEKERKLAKFFSRFGFETLENPCTINGVETKLMVKQMKNDYNIAPVIHRVVPDFYSYCMGDRAEKYAVVKQR